tara:strand:- start:179 stop:367 length:189 start_codon:yes stop_codon:yes gene_type:complete
MDNLIPKVASSGMASIFGTAAFVFYGTTKGWPAANNISVLFVFASIFIIWFCIQSIFVSVAE